KCLPHEILDWHFWIPVCGMEGKLLPRGFAGGEDASFLRRTIQYHRGKLHLPPNSGTENDRELVPAYRGNVSIYLKGAAKSHAFREAAQLRRHGRLLLRRCERIGVTAWPGLISTSAKFEERCPSARAFYGIVAGEYAGSLRVSPRIMAG